MEKARDFFTLPMLRRYCGRDGFAQSREQDSSSKACWFCNVNYNEPDAAHAQSLEHRLVLLLAAVSININLNSFIQIYNLRHNLLLYY